MTDADAPSRFRNPIDPIIVGIVVLACLLFVWAIFEAGHASVLCDPPPAKLPDGGVCDAEGRPLINPFLTLIVTPLAATLSTYFGAALGIANVQAFDTGSRNQPWRFLLRWGGLIRRDSHPYSMIQTWAAYFYLFGLLVAGIYLYVDLQPPTTETLDTPYTHIIIKTCGSSLAGVIMGVLALSLGVKPQKP
ncbi:hypothetical protein EGJ28_15145 [Stutzerimonas xanthomarina]|uniref:Uncharacterized protein n=1 Tax=Stutzerimonas xanthomarina TaxID=271420 RepID=A0A3R8UBH0_9GAMM|nr:hypothetical protein [Stutzerimonas xanthomarina]RRV10021.1 hypothetical protein EGJ28_15145 [Stutzerimonas xanthomarina]